jgi:hypothetical protein
VLLIIEITIFSGYLPVNLPFLPVKMKSGYITFLAKKIKNAFERMSRSIHFLFMKNN